MAKILTGNNPSVRFQTLAFDQPESPFSSTKATDHALRSFRRLRNLGSANPSQPLRGVL